MPSLDLPSVMKSPIRLAACLANWRRVALAAAFTALPLALGWISPVSAQDQSSGVTTAVNPDAMGTPVRQPARVLEVGADIFEKELLTTGGRGQTQLLFRDGSTITIGPNASLTIDNYVYDPSSGAGKIAATAASGFLRFVGGRISKSTEVAFKTPSGEVGVRGGVALIDIDPTTKATTCTLVYGDRLRCAGNNNSEQNITRAGYSVLIPGDGSSPSSPFPMTDATIAKLPLLEGIPGINGGAPIRPTNQLVAGASLGPLLNQLGVIGRGLEDTKNTSQDPSQSRNQVATVSTDATQKKTTQDESNTLITQGLGTDAQLAALYNVKAGSTLISAYNVSNPSSLQSSIPFLTNPNLPLGTAVVSPLYLVVPTGTFVTGGTATFLQASVNINGTGFNQTSEIVVASGDIERSTTRSRYVVGVVSGSMRVQANFNFAGVSGVLTSVPTGQGGTSFLVFTPNSFQLTSGLATSTGTTSANIVSQVFSGNNALPNTTVTYGYTGSATSTALPSGTGLNRTTQVLSGYANALVNIQAPVNVGATSAAASDRYFISTNQLSPDMQVATNASTSRVGAAINLNTNITTPSSSAVGAVSLNLAYGGNGVAASSFVDDQTYGSSSGSATVNGSSSLGTQSMYFVSSATALPNNILPSGVSYCSCQYAQWGFFGGTILSPYNSDIRANNITMGLWVAGPLPNTSDIPTSGTATYTGAAIGTVQTVGTIGGVSNTLGRYIAVGGLVGTYNFGTKSGTFNISNFDGANYTSAVSSSNARDYAGTLTGTGRTGTLSGSFYKSPSNPVAETGGQFTILNNSGGTTYQAVGVFTAKR
ncbi:MAG TPA: hypothetical protein VNT30_11120 [Stellaceae bacterium]|nr:hypothetical protein [Stellaceae bacterium]